MKNLDWFMIWGVGFQIIILFAISPLLPLLLFGFALGKDSPLLFLPWLCFYTIPIGILFFIILSIVSLVMLMLKK